MSTKAKSLALSLLRQNKKFKRSWRVIAREDFNSNINHATLNRIANSKGAWLPKDKKILIALGLKHEKKTAIARQPKDLFDMATSTLRKALINREPMPPVDSHILREFKRLGWIKKVKA